MDASGHGHVMTNDQKTRDISLTQAGGWELVDDGDTAVDGSYSTGDTNITTVL